MGSKRMSGNSLYFYFFKPLTCCDPISSTPRLCTVVFPHRVESRVIFFNCTASRMPATERCNVIRILKPKLVEELLLPSVTRSYAQVLNVSNLVSKLKISTKVKRGGWLILTIDLFQEYITYNGLFQCTSLFGDVHCVRFVRESRMSDDVDKCHTSH